MNQSVRAQIKMEMYPEGDSKIQMDGAVEDIATLMAEGIASFYSGLIKNHSYTKTYATTMINAITKIGLKKGRDKI